MKWNKLFSALLRGTWAITPQAAMEYFPLVQTILDGKFEDLPANDKPEAIITYMDTKGRMYGHSWEDPADNPDNAVAIVEVIGAITKYGGMCQYGAEEIGNMISMLMRSDKVKGIILKTDSPGGAVNAIAPLIDPLIARTKPVVALCDTCASAGYYTAIHTDHIMADNTISASFGSIGVMVKLADMKGYYEQKGVKFHTIYSNHSEHKNQAFELALEGEYDAIREEHLDPFAISFQSAVKKQRGVRLDQSVPGVLSGKMFFAEEAKQIGLIDSIGNIEMAMDKVLELQGSYNLKRASKFL